MFDAVTYALAKKFTKAYVEKHAGVGWNKAIVDEIPDPTTADPFTLYFVAKNPLDHSEGFTEYMLVDDQMELIGDTTVDIDLHDVGFMMDEDDDELLIIDCDTIFDKVRTATEFLRYIEVYCDITISSEYRDSVKSWYEWFQTQSATDKNNVYLFIYITNPYNTVVRSVYYVYTTGIPVISVNDQNEYELRSYLDNGTPNSFGQVRIYYSAGVSQESATPVSIYSGVGGPPKDGTSAAVLLSVDDTVKYDLKQFNKLAIEED